MQKEETTGDHQEFDEMYRRTQAEIYKFIRYRVADKELAKDVLDTNIPEPVYCERAATPDDATPVRAHARPGPRPAPPFDPNAPVQTNIRVGDGNNGPG